MLVKYYIYMMRCSDGSLYCGITTDIKRRASEHINKDEKCAKYTKSHTAVSIAAVWETDEGRSAASKLEHYLKKQRKENKEALVSENGTIELDGHLFRRFSFS